MVQIGSTTSIAALLQRVGRAGHHKSLVPKGRLFPLTRDELVEGVALLDAVLTRDLDELVVPAGGLDVLGQQIIAALPGDVEIGLGDDLRLSPQPDRASLFSSSGAAV